MTIFERELETMPRPELERVQLERLRELLAMLRRRVPLYRERLSGADDVESLDDLRRLPFTYKDDLRDAYPFGLLAVPRTECVRVHASSGTTGKPIIAAYTSADIDLFARVNARALAAAGAEPGMTLHNAYGYGLFTGGLGLHSGGERLGLTVVPVSGGLTERQLLLIGDLRPDLISCTPSYALTLAQAFAERGVPPEEISLRFAVLGAEPWTEAMRAEIDAGLGVTATNIYGLTEVIGPGVSGECVESRAGAHVSEDHFLAEVVDPETREPVADGKPGVLVLTTLTRQAQPVLRYWTGDITTLDREPCRCGRTFARMGLITGRTDDMLIVRGVNLYPTQVEAVLLRVPELTPHYRLILTRERTLDEVEVEVEVSEAYLGSIGGSLESPAVAPLERRVEELIRETIGASMKVTLLAPGYGPRSEGGKLARVDDRRLLR